MVHLLPGFVGHQADGQFVTISVVVKKSKLREWYVDGSLATRLHDVFKEGLNYPWEDPYSAYSKLTKGGVGVCRTQDK